MKYMQCTTCKKTVEVNNTGTCLECQGFLGVTQKDIWQKKQSKLCQVLQREKIGQREFWAKPNVE